MDHTIYHIYAKDKCLYNCLNEEEFTVKWAELKVMVGLMKTDFKEEDLCFEKLSPGVGGGPGSTVNWKDPDGGDSY